MYILALNLKGEYLLDEQNSVTGVGPVSRLPDHSAGEFG